MSTSSLSFFAGPCMLAHSPGMAGRSTGLEERSYSSMCFRTAKGQEGRFKSGFSGPARRGRGRPGVNWPRSPVSRAACRGRPVSHAEHQ